MLLIEDGRDSGVSAKCAELFVKKIREAGCVAICQNNHAAVHFCIFNIRSGRDMPRYACRRPTPRQHPN